VSIHQRTCCLTPLSPLLQYLVYLIFAIYNNFFKTLDDAGTLNKQIQQADIRISKTCLKSQALIALKEYIKTVIQYTETGNKKSNEQNKHGFYS
jgi:hypothetical protein